MGTKSTYISTLTLLWRKHADEILNSQKLVVNFEFTTKPCIQGLYLLLFSNVIKNKVNPDSVGQCLSVGP